jgi:UDP-2-acetamido-2,6-beta-L-arabino-hexul-4-ose reductase
MVVLVTGSDGFIGKNLSISLNENLIDFRCFNKKNSVDDLTSLVSQVDFIFHLAGVNRSLDPLEFDGCNRDLTQHLCDAIEATGRIIPIVYTSTILADSETNYGRSKKAGEEALIRLNARTSTPVYIYRLPNVFGKWCKPNYNSVVATFCNNISQNLPIQIHEPDKIINLLYIDDIVKHFISMISFKPPGVCWPVIGPAYKISLNALAQQIKQFRDSRDSLVTEEVGVGLTRLLYATYLSYLKPENFAYKFPIHGDSRGVFAEIIKTKKSGQFSYFSAHPGVTRGGHYHHTKSEKFIVMHGIAKFRFRHTISGDTFEIIVNGPASRIIETVPGWAHDITNIGENELVVALWSSELFDAEHTDTISNKL